jgi:hypothetical protein
MKNNSTFSMPLALAEPGTYRVSIHNRVLALQHIYKKCTLYKFQKSGMQHALRGGKSACRECDKQAGFTPYIEGI